MLRSKSLIIVCHCVLNENSVVCPLARAEGSFKFVKHLIDEGIGIIQLPCPELKFLGTTRKPMEKEEYDTLDYRNLCRNLLIPVVEDMEIYQKDGYRLKGIIGINESPTCSISGSQGIFMEELFSELGKRNIELDYTEVTVDYEDDRDSEKFFYKIKKKLIE